MVTYNIEKDRAAYVPGCDILYVAYGNGSLDICDTIYDFPGITVMITDGKFSGAEIYDFKRKFGGWPADIEIPFAPPFVISIPSLDS